MTYTNTVRRFNAVRRRNVERDLRAKGPRYLSLGQRPRSGALRSPGGL